MIAYDPTGSVFAIREGAELLVHDGPSEGPRWRKTLDSTIVGLGASASSIVAVTERGTVAWFDARTGAPGPTQSVRGPVRRAAVDVATRHVIAATDTETVVLRSEASTQLAAFAATAVATGANGDLALASAQGEFRVIGANGQTTASLSLGEPIRGVAWHPSGFWVIGLRTKLLRWESGDSTVHITNMPDGTQVDSVACTDKAIAIAYDDRHVVVIAWPSRDTLGCIDYLERKAEGVAFGPWPWLGIAMDLGDANKLNLVSGALHRSDTHPGRQHHSWLVMNSAGPKRDDDDDDAAPAHQAPAAQGGVPPIAWALFAMSLIVLIAIKLAL